MERIYLHDIYESKAVKPLKLFSDIFLGFCLMLAIFTLVFNSLFTAAEVFETSMYPTINYEYDIDETHRDIVYYTNLFGYNNGDIVIIDSIRVNRNGIKRLIAKGGDKICFGNINNDNESEIKLNGEVLFEDYINNTEGNISAINDFKNMIKQSLGGNEEKIKREWLSEIATDVWEITLPEDYVIYLGDNRGNSTDCSETGPQKVDKIIGKVWLIVPYGTNVITQISYKFWSLFKK